MVYYYTSANIKTLRNILKDYENTNETSPYEYMKNYIEKCSENTDNAKVSWVVETFLSYYKHQTFLMEINTHMSQPLSEIDQEYFMIIFHAVVFHVRPEDRTSIYKSVFNLSKSLLNVFTSLLSNNEILPFISQVAHSSYDTNYITDKIIGPLFEWQPYFSEMAHNYSTYLKKIEAKNLKPLTVPIHPNVLNRKGKSLPPNPSLISDPAPETPPNSVQKKTKKMLTKTVIDERLKVIHDKNKQRAKNLLDDVKNKDLQYARIKTNTFDIKHAIVKLEMEYDIHKPCHKLKQNVIPKSVPSIKHTTATLKRLHKRIQKEEEDEIKWFEDILTSNKNTLKIEEIAIHDRQEMKREILLDIEKKHLMGQISHEEAALAKQKVQEENKQKYDDFLKEKESWNVQIENWKKAEMEKNRKQIEKKSLDELKLAEAKNEVSIKKKVSAEKLKKETEEIAAKALKEKQEELDRKIKVIKEIRILAMIGQKAKVPKVIDLTETSGLGLLCEMSIAELQERLCSIKIELKEDLDTKKRRINEQNNAAKQQLMETKTSIESYINERAMLRKNNKNSNVILNSDSVQEISDLKKILKEKRKLRMEKAHLPVR